MSRKTMIVLSALVVLVTVLSACASVATPSTPPISATPIKSVETLTASQPVYVNDLPDCDGAVFNITDNGRDRQCNIKMNGYILTVTAVREGSTGEFASLTLLLPLSDNGYETFIYLGHSPENDPTRLVHEVGKERLEVNAELDGQMVTLDITTVTASYQPLDDMSCLNELSDARIIEYYTYNYGSLVHEFNEWVNAYVVPTVRHEELELRTNYGPVATIPFPPIGQQNTLSDPAPSDGSLEVSVHRCSAIVFRFDWRYSDDYTPKSSPPPSGILEPIG